MVPELAVFPAPWRVARHSETLGGKWRSTPAPLMRIRMRGSPSRSQTSAVALEVCTRCDDDEPQLIRCPHRDHVAFEQQPIRIIRGYRILTLPLHLGKRGSSVLPTTIPPINPIPPP